MQAIGYAPGVIASLLLIYQRKWLWARPCLTCFSALQGGTLHLQVVYYTFDQRRIPYFVFISSTAGRKGGEVTVIGMAIAAGAASSDSAPSR